MKKDFQRWHQLKSDLHEKSGQALFQEREIWWCALGANVGFEQDGSGELFTRPVLILTKFNLDVCLVVPLTARLKKGKYYFPVGNITGRDAVAVLSQIRFIDRKRLAKKIATLNESTFQKLTAQIIEVCFPDRNK